LRDQRRRHQVTAHDQLPCADFNRFVQRVFNLPSYSSPVIQRWLDFRKFSTMAASNEITTARGISPNHATRQSMRALTPTRFPVFFQVEHHVVFFGELQDFFQCGDALAREFAPEPRSGIQPPQIGGASCRATAPCPFVVAIYGRVVNGHEARIARKLQNPFR